MMKGIIKGAIRGQEGNAFILVLILLVVGGLVLAPMLGLMSTGLLAGQVYEKKTDELYAADAGVEDAVWKIQHQVDELPRPACAAEDPEPWSYMITDDAYKINGKDVGVAITYVNNLTYQVVSTATGNGSATQVEAYVACTIDYCNMLDNLVTIHDSLDESDIIQLNNDLAKLNIPCPEECYECDKCAQAYDYNSDAYRDLPKECRGCIAVYNFPDEAWPTVSELSARYLNDVEDAEHRTSTTIDLKNGDVVLPELYVDGTFAIGNTDNKVTHTVTLEGTLYITGDTEIGVTGGGTNKPSITLDLNGNTIFVASNSTGHEALKIGAWCGITGPGAIIAVGEIYFKPNQVIGSDPEPAFVLSVSATTKIQSGASFVGAIGSYGKDVCLQSGGANIAYPEGGFPQLNFTFFDLEAKRTYRIVTWEVGPAEGQLAA
jgi:hypothetical protein